ncbi:MAG: energy transducer TonB [Proteobacteria bacterium]|nr:energy transducer TonB [Pseudomonadota bacterium]
MRYIKTHPLILSTLVSLSLHGLLAVLLIPSFLKVSPEGPVAFEVAWVMSSPPCQSQSSPCHPRPGGDPGESLQKTSAVVRTLSPSLKKVQPPSTRPLDPRLRRDDMRGGRDNNGMDGDDKYNRHCEAPQEPKQPRKPTITGVLRYARNDEVRRTQPHHPLPSYPWVCRKRRQEGVVCLHVKTNKEGHVIEASLHKSSGHALLDKAALDAVKAWTFKERNFQKILSIAFRLKEEKVSFS